MKRKMLFTSLLSCSAVLSLSILTLSETSNAMDVSGDNSLNHFQDLGFDLKSHLAMAPSKDLMIDTGVSDVFLESDLDGYEFISTSTLDLKKDVDVKKKNLAQFNLYKKDNGRYVLYFTDGVLYGDKDNSIYGDLDVSLVEDIYINRDVTLYKDSSYLFSNFENLKNVYGFSDLDYENVVSFEYAFSNDSALETFVFGSGKLNKELSVSNMFSDANHLKFLDISKANFKNISSDRKDGFYTISKSLESLFVSENTGSLSFLKYDENMKDSIWDVNSVIYSVEDLLVYNPVGVTSISLVADSGYTDSQNDHLTDSNDNALDTIEDDITSPSSDGSISDDTIDDVSNAIPADASDTYIAEGTIGTSKFNFNASTGELRIYGGTLAASNNDLVGVSSIPVLKSSVRKIIISESVKAPENSKALFMGYDYESGVEFENFNRIDFSNVKDASFMFANSNFNRLVFPQNSFKSTTNMSNMFANAFIPELQLNNISTSSVQNMSHMFFALKTSLLDTSKFDFSNATDVSGMYSRLEIGNSKIANANNLKLPKHLDTSKVTNMSNMFANTKYSGDFNLDLNTLSVKNMSFMFAGFGGYDSNNEPNINKFMLNGFYNFKVTNFSSMFQGFSAKRSSFGDGFGTASATNMSRMFLGANFEFLDDTAFFNRFETSRVTDMSYMFNNMKVKNIKTFDITSFDTSSVVDMTAMFASTNFEGINVNTFNTKNVKHMSQMFANSPRLQFVKLFTDVNNVQDFSYMFANDYALKDASIALWQTTAGRNYESMLLNCSSLEKIEMPFFNLGYSNGSRDGGYNVSKMLEGTSPNLLMINSTIGPLGDLSFAPAIKSDWVSDLNEVIPYNDLASYQAPSGKIVTIQPLYDDSVNGLSPDIIIPNKPNTPPTNDFDHSQGNGGIGWDSFYINFASNLNFTIDGLQKNNGKVYNDPVQIQPDNKVAPFVQFTTQTKSKPPSPGVYRGWSLIVKGSELVSGQGDVLKGATLNFQDRKLINSSGVVNDKFTFTASQQLSMTDTSSLVVAQSSDFYKDGTWTVAFTNLDNGAYNSSAGVYLTLPSNVFISTRTPYTGSLTWVLSATP